MSMDFIERALNFMAGLFVLAIGVAVVAVVILYIIDITQKESRYPAQLPGSRALSLSLRAHGGVFSAVFLCDGPGGTAV